MENALVLAPEFMNYDQAIVKAWSETYDVTLINNEKYLYTILNGIQKSFFKQLGMFLNRKLGRKDRYYDMLQTKYYGEYLQELGNKNYQKIICINGHCMPDKFYETLRKRNPDAKMILYLWDDISNLLKHTHFSYFDQVYSYNLDDCKEYSLQYMPMMTQNKWMGHGSVDKYDIAIIGTAHPDRLEEARKIYQKYREKYRFYIYFYHPDKTIDFFGHRTPLSYEEYVNILRQSSAVLDLPFREQKGLTTRPFDALLTETKVITSNANIRRYPVYSGNIMIIDWDDPEIPETFIRQSYQQNDRRVLNAEEWLKEIFKD